MTSAKQLLGNKNFRNCFPFGDKLGSLDVECLAGEGPGPLGAAGPGAPNGFGAFELFLQLLVAVTSSTQLQVFLGFAPRCLH